ncbi:MAG: hypothetical protein KC489_10360, partial [Gemmatimonadetes bacterium]|nr:hypothetical protein [Gemmatimonadota bacterium]
MGEEVAIAGQRLEAGGIDRAQQPDRVVVGLAPADRIDPAEDGPGLAVPAPGEVAGEGGQPLETFGERGQLGPLQFGDVHRSPNVAGTGWGPGGATPAAPRRGS